MGEEMKEKPSYNLLKEEVIGNCKGWTQTKSGVHGERYQLSKEERGGRVDGTNVGASATWRIMTGGLVNYFKGGFVLRLWALIFAPPLPKPWLILNKCLLFLHLFQLLRNKFIFCWLFLAVIIVL